MAILKMLAYLSASIFTSKSNNCSLIGHRILFYNFHKYCMIYRLSMLEKLMNKMRDNVCRRFLHHIVLIYYIWDSVCRTFMRHIVVSYYIWDNVCLTLMRHIVVSYYIRDTVCWTFMRHILVSYYISDNVCRTFMRHIVVIKLGG